MTWAARSDELVGGRAVRVAVEDNSLAVTFDDVLRLWRDSPEFRTWFNDQLAALPFSAFRWETPPVTTATVGRPFEFVAIDSPGLARKPDVDAFAEQFRGAGGAQAIEFLNLGRDAIMVVPCPLGDITTYGHIGAFVRQAPISQQHALWSLVGMAMQRRLGNRPVWLSTAGAGVSWLHVRLDDRPKYYGHAPYRSAVEV